MTRIIAIASGKGGVGKTMLVSNLGIAIAKTSQRCMMVDADLDMANLELALGMEGRPITLQDVLNNQANIQDAIYEVIENVKFVPAGISPAQLKRVDPEKLASTIKKLEPFADIILLDSPAGIGKDTIACFSAAQEVILITTPTPMGVTDAYKTKIAAEKMGLEIVGIVLNMIKNSPNELKDKEISSLLGCEVIARIKDNQEIRRAVLAGKPFVKEKPQLSASKIIGDLATKLTGGSYKPEVEHKESWFSRMFGFLKKKR